MPYENWDEYLKEIEKRKVAYQEKYYPTSSRRFVYFFQGNPDNTISFSSKYWQHLVETRYKDLFIPIATIPAPKEKEETNKLQDEVKKLNAKVNELKTKVGFEYDETTKTWKPLLDKDGKPFASLTDLRNELDELKKEIQLAGIKKESFEDLKKQNQDLLKKIHEAEAEPYILHAQPVKKISQIISKQLEVKQKEHDNLKNKTLKEAKRENKRLELINGYLKRKLGGEILSEAEKTILDILENKTGSRELETKITIENKEVKVKLKLDSWEKMVDSKWTKEETRKWWEEVIKKAKLN